MVSVIYLLVSQIYIMVVRSVLLPPVTVFYTSTIYRWEGLKIFSDLVSVTFWDTLLRIWTSWNRFWVKLYGLYWILKWAARCLFMQWIGFFGFYNVSYMSWIGISEFTNSFVSTVKLYIYVRIYNINLTWYRWLFGLIYWIFEPFQRGFWCQSLD